jgi:hypothetical protein
MTRFTADVIGRIVHEPREGRGTGGRTPRWIPSPRAGLDGPSRPVRVEPVRIPQTEPRETPEPAPREAPVPDREREPAAP